MSEPTDPERQLIKQLRASIEDITTNSEEIRQDSFLIRWIRARDHDLGKAEEMLRQSLEWRQKLDVDQALTSHFDPWFTNNFPYWIDTVDKLGHPVMEMPLGSWDIRKAMGTEREEYFVNHINRYFEDVMLQIRKANKDKTPSEWPVTQWTGIIDWKGYSYAQLIHWKALQNTLKMAATMEAHYPEILYKCYFINCPKIFPLFMTLLSRIMAPKTISKISCYGERNEWESVLMNDIDADQLGTLYGGNKIRKVGDTVYAYPV